MSDQSNTRRRRRQGGDEADAYSHKWRQWIRWRAGGRKGIKRRTHRQERRAALDEIRRERA